MIIWLPLEQFEQRYTEDWYRQFPRQFEQDGVDFITVDGTPLTTGIELGSVLDGYGTNYWKMSQLANLIKLIRNGTVTSDDVLLFADLWFPGIESLEYIACLGGARPKITGVLHAGTWDSNDFTVRQGMRPWGHCIEQAWFQMYDMVFVATQYHKDLILTSHPVNPDKIVVTGLPFYPNDIPRCEVLKDDRLIVFPHRLDKEKHPEEYDGLIESLPWAKSLKTAEHYTTKKSYYEMLARSSIAVSMATQETFGYAMLEATALGCIPLVPDRLSYQEMYPRVFRYQTSYELKCKVEELSGNLPYYRQKTKELAEEHEASYSRAISRMVHSGLYLCPK